MQCIYENRPSWTSFCWVGSILPSSPPQISLLSFLLPSLFLVRLPLLSIRNTLTFFPDPGSIAGLSSLPPVPLYHIGSKGKKWGRHCIHLLLWHTTINTHRKWQTREAWPQGIGRERGVCVSAQGRARGKRRGSELLPICLANVVQTSPHLTLFTVTRKAQSWRIVMHLVTFFFPSSDRMLIALHTHTCKSVYRRISAENKEQVQTQTQTPNWTNRHMHGDSRRHTQGCHTYLALCLLAGFVPSITPWQPVTADYSHISLNREINGETYK